MFLNKAMQEGGELLDEVFAEEAGHHLDAWLGGGDSRGDEGALFVAGVRAGSLDPEQLGPAASENDSGTIQYAGQTWQVEFHDAGSAMGALSLWRDNNPSYRATAIAAVEALSVEECQRMLTDNASNPTSRDLAFRNVAMLIRDGGADAVACGQRILDTWAVVWDENPWSQRDDAAFKFLVHCNVVNPRSGSAHPAAAAALRVLPDSFLLVAHAQMDDSYRGNHDTAIRLVADQLEGNFAAAAIASVGWTVFRNRIGRELGQNATLDLAAGIVFSRTRDEELVHAAHLVDDLARILDVGAEVASRLRGPTKLIGRFLSEYANAVRSTRGDLETIQAARNQTEIVVESETWTPENVARALNVAPADLGE